MEQGPLLRCDGAVGVSPVSWARAASGQLERLVFPAAQTMEEPARGLSLPSEPELSTALVLRRGAQRAVWACVLHWFSDPSPRVPSGPGWTLPPLTALMISDSFQGPALSCWLCRAEQSREVLRVSVNTEQLQAELHHPRHPGLQPAAFRRGLAEGGRGPVSTGLWSLLGCGMDIPGKSSPFPIHFHPGVGAWAVDGPLPFARVPTPEAEGNTAVGSAQHRGAALAGAQGSVWEEGPAAVALGAQRKRKNRHMTFPRGLIPFSKAGVWRPWLLCLPLAPTSVDY